MTRKRMTELRYSNDDIEAVTELVALHLRFHTYDLGWTDAAVRRYVRDAGQPARRVERAHPVRLHDPQRTQGGTLCRGGWTSSRRASPNWPPKRSSRRSVPSSTAPRSWLSSGWRPAASSARHWRSCSRSGSTRASSATTRRAGGSTSGSASGTPQPSSVGGRAWLGESTSLGHPDRGRRPRHRGGGVSRCRAVTRPIPRWRSLRWACSRWRRSW